jgi:hypothetical protein
LPAPALQVLAEGNTPVFAIANAVPESENHF